MTGHEPSRAADASGPQIDLAVLVRASLDRRVSDLRVEYDGRGLVLRGRADTYHVKQLAQHVAMAVVGLPLSANEIVVATLRGEQRRPVAKNTPYRVPVPHTSESGPHTGGVAAKLESATPEAAGSPGILPDQSIYAVLAESGRHRRNGCHKQRRIERVREPVTS